MARYPSRTYGRRKRRKQKRFAIISALIVLLVLAIFIFKNRSTDDSQDQAVALQTNPQAQAPAEATQVIQTEPQLLQVSQLTEDSNPEVSKLFEGAIASLEDNTPRIIEARDRLNETLPMPMSTQQRQFAKQQLTELSQKWLFSRTVFPDDTLCGTYEVKSGDQLRSISKKFKVPYEILMQINNIKHPEQLQANQTIKVINGPFHARIYRSNFTMDLFLQNTYVRSFRVGLGLEGRETPRGLWVVEPGGKLIKPTWTDPDTGRTYEAQDPDYPLGSRWIRLKGLEGEAVGRTGIAFHGTNDPNAIGAVGSRGCIRLYNGDVILVYNLMMPGYSQIEVVD